jgi:hypothetical protein
MDLKDCTCEPDTSLSKLAIQQQCAGYPVFARENGPDLNTEARPDRTAEVGRGSCDNGRKTNDCALYFHSNKALDSSEPNVLLEECNYNEGQSSIIPHDARASNLNTDGQLRDILSDMKPIKLLIKSEILCLMWNQST